MSSYMAAEARISLLNLFQGAVLVVAANLAFFLMVFVVDATINHRILYEKLASAAALGVIDDRDYPADLATYSDRYTDCVALGLNLVDGPDRRAFGLMRDTEIAKVDGLNACSALMMMVKDKKSVSAVNYGRYWHGYQILSKPFLRFGDIRNLRYILACLVIGAVFTFSTIIAIGFTGTVSGVFQGLWFGLGYLLLTDGANLGNVFTHSLSLLAIFSMPLAVFWAIKAGVRRSLFLMAVAVGSVNAFFDLLFNPPLGLSTLGYRVKPRPYLLALLAPAFISALWFEIFRNHSQHHHWFTYRSASFSLVCLAAAVIFSFSRKLRPGEIEAPGSRKSSVVQPGELYG